MYCIGHALILRRTFIFIPQFISFQYFSKWQYTYIISVAQDICIDIDNMSSKFMVLL